MKQLAIMPGPSKQVPPTPPPSPNMDTPKRAKLGPKSKTDQPNIILRDVIPASKALVSPPIVQNPKTGKLKNDQFTQLKNH